MTWSMQEFNLIAGMCTKPQSKQRTRHSSPEELQKSRNHSPEPWFSSCTLGLTSPLQSCQKVWSNSTAWAPGGSQETQEVQWIVEAPWGSHKKSQGNFSPTAQKKILGDGKGFKNRSGNWETSVTWVFLLFLTQLLIFYRWQNFNNDYLIIIL